MKYTTILFSTLLVFALSTSSVLAIETDAELRARIGALRTTHTELKAQVQAGTLTAEEARTQWQELLAKARAEKEAFFEKKRAQIEERYEELREKNPERAALIDQRFNAMKERHEARVDNRVELRTKVHSGELSVQEANKVRVDFVKEQHEDYLELKANFKEQRLELRGESAQRPGGFINIGDVKGETRTNVKVAPLPIDPFGMNALEVFPRVKEDVQRARELNASKGYRMMDN